jgi:DNA topoisomerase VI subunit B
MAATPKLQRTAFRTSRLLDFCSYKELTTQTGHQPGVWPLVVLKELVDNALDACEDATISPVVTVSVNGDGIQVQDNGRGLPAEVVEGVLDFSMRVSSREAYVAPDRGAQGNALKSILAMPFVLDGTLGRVDIEARGIRHAITMRVDRLRQQPVLERKQISIDRRPGTKMRVYWPDSASSILHDAKARFVQIADDYTFINPHLALTVDWFGESVHIKATDPRWKKWLPSNPTCPHWYGPEHFERLLTAYIAHDLDTGRRRTVREFVSEFCGLSRTGKQKAVLDQVGLSRTALADLVVDDLVQPRLVLSLLRAMQRHSKPVRPVLLGPIGKEHLSARFDQLGCEMETFKYRRLTGQKQGVPGIVEAAFGWCPRLEGRRLVTGVNWSPGILNPFRQLGKSGRGLDAVLERQRAGRDEPICVFLHLICPRVEYTDRGKSAVVVWD